MMGGFGAHEYMAPCPAGENDVALASGYAANIEVATRRPGARHAAGGARGAGTGQTPELPGSTTSLAELGCRRARC